MRKFPSRRRRFERLEPRLALDASALRITEFVASNDDGLRDVDGDQSDWLEIYNAGAEPVDLAGLHLTDDADERNKWEFPAGHTLDPGALLVVFASDKDGELAGGQLHTNFKLSADGEYLALVDADGTTVIDAFAPAFPEQQEDVAYGREMTTLGPGVTVLAEGASAKGIIPTDGRLGTSWTAVDYDDASWPLSGPTGWGYENSPADAVNYTDEIQTTIPSGTTGLYLRVPFNLQSLGGIGELTLNLRYDDGFAAYVNGTLVASAGAPDSLAWNSTAGGAHDDAASEQFASFDISAAIPHLKAGDNVLAIHALNVSSGSSDMLVSPQIVARDSAIVEPHRLGFLPSTTPGWSNQGQPVLGYVATPSVSVPHGLYDSTQSVALQTPTAGALIVYTTDGSTPAVDAGLNVVNGALYINPIPVSSTTVLRARAFKADFEPSQGTASSYLFLDDVIEQSPNGQAPGPGWPAFNVNGQEIDYGIDPQIVALYGEDAVKDSLASLPTFSISTDTANLFDPATGIYVNAQNRGRDWERPASVELIDPTGAEAGFTINAGLRIRGGYSRGDFNPKHAFRLYFRGDYGPTKLEYPLFGDEGVDEFDVLDLRTAQNYSWSSEGNDQNTFLREVFARDLQADLGQPYTRSRYVQLYVDGVYWGVYMTEERVQKDYAQSYFGGGEDDYDVVKADNGNGYVTEVADGNDGAWRQLFELAQGLASSPDNYWAMQGLTPTGERDPGLPVLLDVQNLVDYMLIIFYTGGYDVGLSEFLGNNLANNWVGVYDRVGAEEGFQFFMHDNEHSLGTNGTDNIDRTGPFNNANQNNFAFFNPHTLHQILLSSPEYRLAFADQVRQLFFDGGATTPAASVARMAERMAQVDPAIIAESARWGDSKRSVPLHRSHWLSEYSSLVNGYFPQRTATVLDQLTSDGLYPSVEAPTFSQHGGQAPYGAELAITASRSIVYYTTDGSDPREPGGAIHEGAVTYDGPVTLTSSVTINARAYARGEWSALTRATFEVQGAGDYNRDGVVNAADFTVWRDTLGDVVPPGTAADGDTDGVIGAGDYGVWRSNYGITVSGPAAAPVEDAAPTEAPAHDTPTHEPLDAAFASLVESPRGSSHRPAAMPGHQPLTINVRADPEGLLLAALRHQRVKGDGARRQALSDHGKASMERDDGRTLDDAPHRVATEVGGTDVTPAIHERLTSTLKASRAELS